MVKRSSPGTTELRSRAQTWSSTPPQKMAVPKNVVTAMEVMKKELTDAMEVQETRIMEKMNDMFDKFVSKVDKMTVDLKKSFSVDIKAMTNEIEGIKKEMAEQNQNIKKVEEKAEETEKTVQDIETEIKANEEKNLKMECQATQLQLRFRGIPESFKDTKEEMIELIADYLKKDVQEIRFQVDKTYRINSDYAHQKDLPRDIMVHFVTRSLKEELLRQQYKQPLEVEGEKTKIMRELPRKVLMLHKNYIKNLQTG